MRGPQRQAFVVAAGLGAYTFAYAKGYSYITKRCA